VENSFSHEKNRSFFIKIAFSDYVKLIPVLGLAFYIAFIPHIGYNYPLHVDEWYHFAFMRAFQNAGSVNFPDPILGAGWYNLGNNLEVGFHVFWGVFQAVSGISWLTIFRFFPGIVFMMTALAVYILGRREGFGWYAALFTCLITTTVGILGPGFLVPVAFGLFIIPLALFVAFNFRGFWSYSVLFILTFFLLTLHSPSAIILVILLAPNIIMSLRTNAWHSMGVTFALLIPFLAPFPWMLDYFMVTVKDLLTVKTLPEWVSFPRIIKSYGYLPMALCLLGVFILALKSNLRNYSFILGFMALLTMLVIFFVFGYGVSIIYERGLMYMMLMIGVFAGAGLAWMAKLGFTLGSPVLTFFTRNAGKLVSFVLIFAIFAFAIPERLDINYYKIINDTEYQDFIWIRDNVGTEYGKAVLDPWKANAFAPITGKKVYARLHAFPLPRDEEARAFLGAGCTDSEFLRKNDISIVYTYGECRNPDLTKLKERIYLFRE